MQCQWPGRSSVSKFMSGRLNKRGYYPSDRPSIDVHLLDSRCAQIAARVTKILPNNLVSEKPVELGKLIQVAYLVVILSAFAWAKEFLLPLILAILISFLLAPVVSRLERWRFPGAVAVLSVVAIGFALIGCLCSTLSLEGLDLVNSLSKYRDNIHARWGGHSARASGPAQSGPQQC